MKREQLFRYFFLGVFLLLLFQILHILSPFYTGILGAIVLVLIFFPIHRFVLNKVGTGRPNLSSSVSTGLVTLLIVLPFIFFTWLFIRELSSVLPILERFGETVRNWQRDGIIFNFPALKEIESTLSGLLGIVQTNFQEIVSEILDKFIKLLTQVGKNIPKNAFLVFINMMVMIFTLFFLFRDGPTLFHRFKELVPMDEKHKDLIAHQLYITVTSVVRGVFVVALTQGTLAGIGYLIVGVTSPVVLGFATILAAIIPLIGAATIWLPVAIYYLAQGFLGKGIFLFIWGVLVISLVDNFLRPILIGSRAKLPILFLFFGILGGIKVYGPMGIFLGPLVVALLIAFIKIYREEYSHISNSPQN